MTWVKTMKQMVDNPIQVKEPNIFEDDNNASGVENNNEDKSSNVESNTIYYFQNNEHRTQATMNQRNQTMKIHQHN